ncbi:MAG: class I SAM-dependent methyltransferase [Candidatus Omnitrophica bacterium]|nr:class I SAM-dependent methyltransferase [Candidatus Omnitrophota bacterium]
MEDKMFETISECRSCGHKGLIDILHLGDQPLANSLLAGSDATVRKFPLSTAFCPECSLFQLKETVKKEILFDHYVWVTGTSKGARDYAGLFAQRVIEKAGLRPGELVFEIASNDGTVLNQFIGKKMAVLGIEPARNIADIANKNGIRTECCYWSRSSADNCVKQFGRPRVVMARNVIPHVSDLHGVIDGMACALSQDGTGVIEFHSGQTIADELHYDSIYHEHLCYFTLYSLEHLLKRYGLYPFAVDKSPISGGSIVIYFSKSKRPLQSAYLDLLKAEKEAGANELATWEHFAKRAVKHRADTIKLLESLKGKTIVGFGASARSATFMQFCGIGSNFLKAIIDNNQFKQGRWTPAGDVPIVSFVKGMECKPDVIFILAWNFAAEIMDECAGRGFHGQYFLPFPKEPSLVKR